MTTIINAKQNERAELRKFALTLATAFAILSLFLLWKRGSVAAVPATFALAFAALGLACPQILRGVRDSWMRVATLMGSAMSYVVLTVTFFLVLTPIGCVMRMMGRDPLARSIDDSVKSYWIVRDRHEQMPGQYEKMY